MAHPPQYASSKPTNRCFVLSGKGIYGFLRANKVERLCRLGNNLHTGIPNFSRTVGWDIIFLTFTIMGVKHYDKQFKERAVKLSIQRGSISQVAKEVGVSNSQLNKWRKNFEQFGSNSFPGRGIEYMTDEQREIKRLKTKLKRQRVRYLDAKKMQSPSSVDPTNKISVLWTIIDMLS